MNSKFKEKQFQADRQRLLNEIEWLNQELLKKSALVMQLKSEHSQKIYELESSLEKLTADVSLKFRFLYDLSRLNFAMRSCDILGFKVELKIVFIESKYLANLKPQYLKIKIF